LVKDNRGRLLAFVVGTRLEVARKAVAIVGPTGCGKTTLLNVAAGLLRPRSGEMRVFGRRLEGRNRQAGSLFQQAVMPWKTARDNVAIGPEVAGVARSEARGRVQAWLKVGLAAFADRYPHQLSGGQRKRVGLGRS
jgi:NitT/TauT family transport system ATP-binding protein